MRSQITEEHFPFPRSALEKELAGDVEGISYF